MMQRINNADLAQRLAQQVALADDQTPKKALDILLYGWKKFRHYGLQYCNALKHRNWLYITEVMDLSVYAGCDLTKSEPAHLSEAE